MTKRFALDALIFFLPALAFVLIAALRFGLPLDESAQHLFWPAFAWGLSLLVRLGCGAIGGGWLVEAGRLVTALLWSCLLWIQVGNVASLDGWGQFLTFPVVASYVSHVGPLADTVGLGEGWLLAALVAILAQVFLAQRAFARCLPARIHPAWMARRTVVFAALSGLLGAALLYASRVVLVPFSPVEPVANLLVRDRTVQTVQSWQFPSSPVRQEAEASARKAYVPARLKRPPNIILFVVDAFRADRLPLYGHDRETTPHLSALRSSGRLGVAKRFRAVCAESSCGLMALARSKYPWQITGNDISLYEVLRLHGYRNTFLLSGDHTNFYGLRDVFQPADHYFDGSHARSNYPNDDRLLLAELDGLPDAGGQPAFFQFHMMSAHGLGSRDARFNVFLPQENPYKARWNAALGSGTSVVSARNYYDNGVLQVDEMIRSAGEILERKGYLRDAVVIVTGDHGELLGEQGQFTHAKTVLDPVLAPPLVYWTTDPARSLADASHLVSQLDVAPTILKIIGAPAPSTWAGVAIHDRPPGTPSFFFQGNERGAYVERDGRLLKYVHDLQSGSERIEGPGMSGHEPALDGFRRLVEGEIGPFMRGWAGAQDDVR